MAYTKKIEIQHLADAEDSIGNQLKEWQILFRPWAEINTSKANEFFAAAQINSENDLVFKIRYSKLLKGKQSTDIRIVYDGLVYDVKRIEDVNEQHRQYVIRAAQLNGGVGSGF